MLSRILPAAAVCLLAAPAIFAAEPMPASVCEALDASGCTVSSCLANCDSLGGPECGCECGDCGCDDCCCGWYLQADVLFLQRSNGNSRRPLVVTDDTGDTVLTARDLHFDFETGPRMLIGRYFAPGRAWELSYFGTNFWSASASATDTNNLDIPGPLVAVANDFDNADRMVLTYKSQIHNAEFNLASDRGGWTLLGGFRYFNLDERFNINSRDNDGDVSDYTANTSNNLFGGQLGARVRRFIGSRGGVELVGKSGVFGNAAQQHLLLRDNDNAFTLFRTTARRGTVSFIGDVNLTGTYALTDVWSLRAGYFLMYVNGLALAPDQLDFSSDADTGTRITTGGDMLLHGGNFGLEARW